MANSKTFRLQHRDYHRVGNDISSDETNKKEGKDVPLGVILRRITTATQRRSEHRPAGMLSNEVRGTLYYKGTGDKRLVSTCKVTTGEYPFYHPWFWSVPSVEDILKVFSFSEEKHIQKLALIQSTAGTVMSEPESATKITNRTAFKTKKKLIQSGAIDSNSMELTVEPTMPREVTPSLREAYPQWVNQQMASRITGLSGTILLEDKA
jgi:hypothetical protein